MAEELGNREEVGERIIVGVCALSELEMSSGDSR